MDASIYMKSNLNKNHFSAFIDINGDCSADLILN